MLLQIFIACPWFDAKSYNWHILCSVFGNLCRLRKLGMEKVGFALLALLVLTMLAEVDGAELTVDRNGFVAFAQLDSDHNGYVSRVEARSVSGVEKVFAHADANHDGLLTAGEFRFARATVRATIESK